MPWKRDGSGPRGRGKRTDLANLFRTGEYTLFQIGSRILLILAFIFFVVIAAVSDAMFLGILASVIAFAIATVLLPVDTLNRIVEWIWSGEAADRAYGRYLRIMPGRDESERKRGRGQATARTLAVLALVCVLVLSLFIAGVAPAAADDSEEENCATVEHDYLDAESYVDEFNNSSSIENTDENVRTQIEETDAFVRLKAENPNSYCVDVTVKLHPDIVPPAEVGDVSGTDDDVESTWRNTHDFEDDRSYTEITFTMDADSEVTFAPNRVRVLAIAWKDDATSGDGWRDRLTGWMDSGDLEKRTYKLNSSEGSVVTVPLEHDGDSIDGWQASYRVGEDDRWKPIGTESTDPAYYQTTDGGESVEIHFDDDEYPDGEVEVEFTANPNGLDKAKQQVRSLTAGFSDLFNLDGFLSATALPAGASR